MGIIDNYYNTILNLRVCHKFVTDIKNIEYIIQTHDIENGNIVISDILTRYRKDFNNIAKIHSAKTLYDVEDASTVYSPNDWDNMINDMLYIKDCLIMIAGVYCGLAPSLAYIIKKINIENQAK